jgi:hypothetical protein
VHACWVEAEILDEEGECALGNSPAPQNEHTLAPLAQFVFPCTDVHPVTGDVVRPVLRSAFIAACLLVIRLGQMRLPLRFSVPNVDVFACFGTENDVGSCT